MSAVKTKKWMKGIAWVALVLGLAAVIYYFPLLMVVFGSDRATDAKYLSYKREFEVVKDFLVEQQLVEKGHGLTIKQEDGLSLYDFYDRVTIDLPDEVEEALSTLREEAFVHKDASLTLIGFSDGCIILTEDAGYYSLVWSPDGRPKKDWNDNGKPDSIRRAGGDWYHVVKK